MFLSSKNKYFGTAKKLVLAATLALLISHPSASYAEIGTPSVTLDKFGGDFNIGGSYVWVNSSSADGDHVYNIPTYNETTGQLEDHYYQLNIKEGVTTNSRYTYTSGHPSNLVGHYINLPLTGNTSSAIGAGIYNNPGSTSDVIDYVVGDFIQTYCKTNTGLAHGGGLDNHGTINYVYGDFIGNTMYAEAYAGTLGIDGAGLRNGRKIGTVVGNFIGNVADAGGSLGAYGGGIANHTSANDIGASSATIDSIEGYFISNIAKTGGGAIYNNSGTIESVNGYFINNMSGYNDKNIGSEDEPTLVSAKGSGGAVYNTNGAINNLQGTFIANTATKDGGAIYNTNGATMNASGNFILNHADENGGAIYNDSATLNQVNMTVDANFINNTAGEHGGAIYSSTDINLLADGHRNVISGNTANGENEAIYMKSTEETIQVPILDENGNPVLDGDNNPTYREETINKVPNLNLKTDNNGEWVINDKINGTAGLYNVNMTGGGTVSLFNDIVGGNVALDSTRLNTMNNDVHVYEFNSFDVSGDSSMTVDVDIKNETMDRLVTNGNYGDLDGTLNVNGMNFINDTNKKTGSVLFAEEDLALHVRNFGGDVGSTHRMYTPIRMYDIQYNIHNDDNRGYFEFTSGWNPSILAAPVVLQAGVQSAMNTTMLYAFNHLDTYTKIPKFDRLTMANGNKYALASTDYNENSALRLYNLRENRTSNRGAWIRPYAAFESIPLKHGPKVDSITYGTFLGFDSDFHEHKHGWHSVWSVYGGYNGGYIDYKGVSANLNGGVLGLTDTFYKGNFWTALTATAGALNADISTMYGSENSTSIYGGIASKTGYNIEFKDGKYILQPIMLASYTFANMLDYHNAAGVKIEANPMHTIQLNPSLRFITNLKNGWQPYARVGMVWNLISQTDVDAGGYHLPDMYIKPYVEYGLGIQKLYNHRFTGFGQAMMRNGGRTGVALTLGFRYALGREGDEDYKNMSGWEKFKAFFK